MGYVLILDILFFGYRHTRERGKRRGATGEEVRRLGGLKPLGYDEKGYRRRARVERRDWRKKLEKQEK